MARAQQHSPFIVPEHARPVTASAPAKGKREAPPPFAIVPDAMVVGDDQVEPHWLAAIELATD
jgi:hypothetical protein